MLQQSKSILGVAGLVKWALYNLHLMMSYLQQHHFSMPVFCNWHKASQFMIFGLGVASDLLPPSCLLHCQLVSSKYDGMKMYSVCHCMFSSRLECDILSCAKRWNIFVEMVHDVNHIIVVVFTFQQHS